MGTNMGRAVSAEALDTPYLRAFINIYNRPPTERRAVSISLLYQRFKNKQRGVRGRGSLARRENATRSIAVASITPRRSFASEIPGKAGAHSPLGGHDRGASVIGRRRVSTAASLLELLSVGVGRTTLKKWCSLTFQKCSLLLSRTCDLLGSADD